jgi:hypothetical protein
MNCSEVASAYSTINANDLSRYVRGIDRAQKANDVGDFFRFAQTRRFRCYFFLIHFLIALLKVKLYHFYIKDDIEAAVKLELQLRSELEFFSCNETQNSGAK